MPSNIPPSRMGIPTASETDTHQVKARYVVSGSGHAAHPDDIKESCRALLAHVTELQQNAQKELDEFEQRIKQRDLAEKRRVAPGWLDSEARLLQPERMSGQTGPGGADFLTSAATQAKAGEKAHASADDQGAQLDRVFGGMKLD